MTTIGVYGGSFDPPHVGHAMVALWAGMTGLVDEVYLVPTYSHAFGKESSPYNARVEWCKALAYISDYITVHEIERRLPQPSYTIDMLRALAETHLFETTLRLIVGADILAESHRWHKWDEIVRDFNPIIVGREGYPPVDGALIFPGVSSTDIRRRLAMGKPVDHLVPKDVLEMLPKSRYAWAR